MACREMCVCEYKEGETTFLFSISNLLVSIFQDFIEFSFLGKTITGDSFENWYKLHIFRDYIFVVLIYNVAIKLNPFY